MNDVKKSNRIFKSAKNKLNSLIKQEVASGHALADAERSFSRRRKLSARSVVALPYRLTDKSLSRCIPFLSSDSANTVQITSSAVCQAMNKIDLNMYQRVFEGFTVPLLKHRPRLFRGHRLLAVDGSEVKVCHGARGSEKAMGKTKKGGTRHFYHLNAEYDVLNHYYTNTIVQPGSEKNEDAALLELARSAEDSPVYIADRGYEALMTFYRFSQRGIQFVIRIKDESSSISILRHYSTPAQDEYDVNFDVVLTDRNTSYVQAHKDRYKYIAHYRKEPEFDGRTHELPLSGRIVRYRAVSEGRETLITVFTNIDREELPATDIAEIYRLRWQEEVAFRDLKHKVDLETVHFVKEERIIAEIYAKLTIYNLISCVRNRLETRRRARQKTSTRKHEYRIDLAVLRFRVWTW